MIEWTIDMGTLQKADEPGGPWTSILDAEDPYSLQLSTAPPKQFFRLEP